MAPPPGHRRDSGPAAQGDNGDRAQQLDRIIAEVSRRRNSGTVVDDAALERKYPHLMPELGERLRTLRAIEAAADHATQRPESPDSTDDSGAPLEEEWRFLSEALHGYELLERLHSGGQGVVYQAIQRSTHRVVAIKVLLHGPLATERQRHRFAREVDLISRLRHPNIVTLYDSGVVRGRHYFAMEFVDGLLLDDHFLLHRPTARERIALLAVVCRAVSYAHQRGIIHRDLKPSNILVDPDGQPHILDFGLAKDILGLGESEGAAPLSITGQVVGTLPYLSPEQVKGLDEEVDVRSDIYSLGVVLYEALAGCFPYAVLGNPEEVRTNILTREPASLRRTLSHGKSDSGVWSGEINDDLEAVVRKALEKEKDRRYQSAAEFADDLDRYLAGEAVQAKADRHIYLVRKTLRRYRVHAAVAAVFVLLLMVSSAVVTALWVQAGAQRDNAREATRLTQSTLNDVVGEIEESVRPLAGGLAVRNRLLDRVDDSLARLKPLVESDAELNDVFVALNEKRGDIAYAQGRRDVAAEHYRVFLEMSQRQAQAEPANQDALRRVARAHRKLALVSDDADAHFEAAIRTGEELVKSRPGDPDAQYELCESQFSFGSHLNGKGQCERAAEPIAAAIETAEAQAELGGSDLRWVRLLAGTYGIDGEICVKRGNAERGAELLTESLQIKEKLAEQEPSNADLRYELLLGYAHLAALHVQSGRPEKARGLLLKAVTAGEHLTEMDPTVATWKHALYTAHHTLAHLLLVLEDLDGAERHCNAAVGLADNLRQLDGGNPRWQYLTAFSRKLRGRVLLARKAPEAAQPDFEASVTEFSSLVSDEPANVDYQSNLAYAHDWLGKCYGQLGRADAALREYQAAFDIRERLLGAQPDVTERKVAIILSMSKLADWHRDRGTREDDEVARRLYSQAEELLVNLQDSGQLAGREDKFEDWLHEIHTNLTELSVGAPSTRESVSSRP